MSLKLNLQSTLKSALIGAVALSLGVLSMPGMADESPSTQTRVGMAFIQNDLPVIAAGHSVIWWGGSRDPKANPLYVFSDPNCSYCHAFYQWVRDHQQRLHELNVQVAIIPVAFLKSSSAGRAAGMIKGGWGAYVQNEEGYRAGEEGGLPPLATLPENKAEFYQLKTNWDALKQMALAVGLNSIGTPFIMFIDGHHKIGMSVGFAAEHMDGMFQTASFNKNANWLPRYE